MKKFFAKLKKDYKYRNAGPGHSLSEERAAPRSTNTSTSGSSREYGTSAANAQAAAAALVRQERLEKKMMPGGSTSHRNVMKAARNQLSNEQSGKPDKNFVDSLQPPEEKQLESAKVLTVDGIYYTCPLSGEIIPKQDYISHLEQFLDQLEPIPSMEISIVKLMCLNTHRENREKAIEIIGKYLNNIKENPTEDKYRKIKWHHKLFQEKVNSQKGAVDFLKSIGWANESLDGLEYLVFNGTAENITDGIAALSTDEIPQPTLHRMPKILSPQEGQTRVELPEDFFKITGKELTNLNSDQKIKSQQLDMLMTKKMRDDAALLSKRTYNYTLIRIRMPDSDYLQGTFNAYEKASSIIIFMKENLLEDFNWVPFKLRLADGTLLSTNSDDTEVFQKTLAELQLVPSATLTFVFGDDEIRSQLPRKLLREK